MPGMRTYIVDAILRYEVGTSMRSKNCEGISNCCGDYVQFGVQFGGVERLAQCRLAKLEKVHIPSLKNACSIATEHSTIYIYQYYV